MNKIGIVVIVGILCLGLLNGCETDFEITAPGKVTPVVFGLLDASTDTQFFRIQKTFLGEGNVELYALEQDSSLFTDVDAWVIWTTPQNDIDSVQLDTVTVHNKKTDGVFFAPDQLMYFAKSSEMVQNPNYSYELKMLADGQKASSTTNLVTMGPVNFSVPPPVGTWSFVSSIGQNGANYNSPKVTITPSPNVGRYNCKLRWNYKEVKTTGTQDKYLDYNLGEQIVTGDANYDFQFLASAFYSFVGDNLEDNTDVIRREIGSIDIIVTAAETKLHTYMQINDPLTQVIQIRPEFSNINGGIGLFSSRFTMVRNKELSNLSREEMVLGPYTNDLCLCDPTPGSDFDCANFVGCN